MVVGPAPGKAVFSDAAAAIEVTSMAWVLRAEGRRVQAGDGVELLEAPLLRAALVVLAVAQPAGRLPFVAELVGHLTEGGVGVVGQVGPRARDRRDRVGRRGLRGPS